MKQTILAAFLVFASFIAHAGVETSTDSNDVILAGYDAVAYFTEDKAVEGDARYTAQHDGAIYRFSSEKNRDLFQENPEKYAPAYGGYCAFGTTFEKKLAVNGKAFKIVDGRLYVNKSLSVYETWSEDIPNNIAKAESIWPKIVHVAPKDL